MKFVDVAHLEVVAGNGGNGVISFLRELFRPLGGPDGGNGGDGGNIYCQGSYNENSLLSLAHKVKWKAENGSNGSPNNCQGGKGKSHIILLPVGTIIKDNDHHTICNIVDDKELFLLAKGGKGGKGNAAFKTQLNRAPNICENGEPGESKKLHLELKLRANVGIIGYPNAGKSTLTSIISAAKPKIGNFPFTSLNPTLGIVYYKHEAFTIADIPGLIEGASQGKGLGLKFLKHIEHCEILLHLMDGEVKDPTQLLANYKSINKELLQFSPELFEKKQIIALNKSETLLSEEVELIIDYFQNNGLTVLPISSFTRYNLEKLVQILYSEIKLFVKNHERKPFSKQIKTISAKDVFVANDMNVFKRKNVWYVESIKVQKVVQKIPLLNKDCYTRLNNQLKLLHVFEILEKNNIKNGDEVDIYGYTFEWKK